MASSDGMNAVGATHHQDPWRLLEEGSAQRRVVLILQLEAAESKKVQNTYPSSLSRVTAVMQILLECDPKDYGSEFIGEVHHQL